VLRDAVEATAAGRLVVRSGHSDRLGVAGAVGSAAEGILRSAVWRAAGQWREAALYIVARS